jgi:predicted DNA-binding transcriptional regulator YafY
MPYRRPQLGALDRMVKIHEELRRGAATNCTKIGQALEVSRKTVVRDITYMRDRLNLPVEFDPKHNTYRYTEPVAAFPTVNVTEGEVFALLVARKALEQYRGTPFHGQLAASFEKLSSGLKDTVSFSPTNDLQSVSFKHVGLGKSDADVFNGITRGIKQGLEVEFDYRKPGALKAARRRVQPYHLSHRENLWYLVGFDVERDAVRTFALPRTTNVSVTDLPFERPADFSPEKFFSTALGVLGGERNYRIVIHFSAAAADRIREREWHDSQKLRDLRDGGLELTLQLGALPEIERWILTWGADAEVIQPKELRTRVKETAAAMVKKYQ